MSKLEAYGFIEEWLKKNIGRIPTSHRRVLVGPWGDMSLFPDAKQLTIASRGGIYFRRLGESHYHICTAGVFDTRMIAGLHISKVEVLGCKTTRIKYGTKSYLCKADNYKIKDGRISAMGSNKPPPMIEFDGRRIGKTVWEHSIDVAGLVRPGIYASNGRIYYNSLTGDELGYRPIEQNAAMSVKGADGEVIDGMALHMCGNCEINFSVVEDGMSMATDYLGAARRYAAVLLEQYKLALDLKQELMIKGAI